MYAVILFGHLYYVVATKARAEELADDLRSGFDRAEVLVTDWA